MKISLEWLRDFVSLPDHLDIRQVVHDLTMTTVEVEAAHALAPTLDGVVAGAVSAVEAAPNSPKHRVAQCDVGHGHVVSVISAADNLRPGMLVAVSTSPAAAIATSEQLGLEALFAEAGPRSAIDLAGVPCSPGDKLADVIGWNDTVFEIDNKSLTNRPDLWSHYGIARELAAIYRTALKPLPKVTGEWPSAELIAGLDSRGASRLSLLHITNVRAEAAPFWMRSRLARIGQRPINFWVDVTNYVMFTVGEPCHAYDAGELSLPLDARFARDGERMVLLDGQEHELDSRALVIADTGGPVALAGVMGGRDSAVTARTTQVLFEAGSFDALTVRRASARLGLRTESSSRFEKALDTQRVDDALAVFVSLVRQIQPDARVAGFQNIEHAATKRCELRVDVDFIQKRLGSALRAEDIAASLEALGFAVTGTGSALNVVAPTWRSTGDISMPHDLVEEIARLQGYDTFEFVPPDVELRQHTARPAVLLERRVKDILTLVGGMQEVVTYPWSRDAFIAAVGLDQNHALGLAAPPAHDQRLLRPSLLPNLLETVATNVALSPSFRIFELGRVFLPEPVPGDDPRESLMANPKHLAAAFVGADAALLFRQAKGVLEAIQRTAQIRALGFTPNPAASWADVGARLGLDVGGTIAGALGVLTKKAKRLAGIKRGDVVMFELNFDLLEALPSRENRYSPLPEQPEVDVDISLVFPDDVTWRAVSDACASSDPLILGVFFVDEYRGQNVPGGHKSLTLRLRLGASTRTLKADEIHGVVERTSAMLQRTMRAQSRG